MRSSNHIVTIIICCILTWVAVSTDAQNSAKKRLETAQASAYKSGEVAGYNEALSWVVNQCKKGSAWYWQGDETPIYYVCGREQFSNQTKVDFVEWRHYIVLDESI